MKKLHYFIVLSFVLLIFSCNKEAVSPENSETSTSQELVKSFTVYSEDKESYMVIDIFDKELSYLNEDLFKIAEKTILNDELIQISERTNQSTVDESDEIDEPDGPSVHISDIHLADGANSLEISCLVNPNLRGRLPKSYKFPSTLDICDSGEHRRVIGFKGIPLNCNRTKWKFEKKASSDSSWETLYKATSYSSSSVVGWKNDNADYEWKIKIDPDKKCDNYSALKILFMEC